MLRLRASGIYGVDSILLLFLGGDKVGFCCGCCEFEVLPRILGERIDTSGSSSSRFSSLTMVAKGSFLDISKSPGKDCLLCS